MSVRTRPAPLGALDGCRTTRLPVGGSTCPVVVESHYYRRVDGVWTCINCGAHR